MSALLTIEHLTKVFPGQVALDDVDLEIEAGTTHALVGQNGSGKSTLIKILAGYHQPTGHEASATYFGNSPGGEPLELGNGRAAERDGLRFVHQDLGLVDALTVVENLALGDGFITRYGRIDWRRNRERAQEALDSLGFDSVDVRLPVGALAPAQKTGVALARALSGWEHNAHLLVLDEPTASLPASDVEHMFAAIRRLKERGVAILYVSHHLDEVFEIADHVSILRDGRRVTTERVEDLDHDRLIELMIGHKIVQGRSGEHAIGHRCPAPGRRLARRQRARRRPDRARRRGAGYRGDHGIGSRGSRSLADRPDPEHRRHRRGERQGDGELLATGPPEGRRCIRGGRPKGAGPLPAHVGHREHDDLQRRSQRATSVVSIIGANETRRWGGSDDST